MAVWIFFSLCSSYCPKHPKIGSSFWNCVSSRICSLICAYYYFRCYCRECDNSKNGKNQDRAVETKKRKNKKPGFSGELTRKKDTDFYADLGLKVIKPRWLLEESLMLFLLLNRKVSIEDKFPSNVGRLQKEFNILVKLEEVSQYNMNKKSFGQLEGKIQNFLQYLNIYDRDSKEDTDESSNSTD